MRITGCNNNHNGHSNRTSFKSVNRVKILKTAFKAPYDLCDVCADFLEKYNEFAAPDFTKRRLPIFSNPRQRVKATMFLESPMYFSIMQKLKRAGVDLSWLRNNVDLQVNGPFSDTHHSFFLYTKKHYHWMKQLLSSDARHSYADFITDAKNKGRGSENPAFTDVCVNNFILEDFQERYPNEKTTDFVVNDLSQLPAVFRQIDF